MRKILLLLYDGQTDKLSYRSLRGTKERTIRLRNGGIKVHPAKLPITPLKLNTIRRAYNQRIEKHCPDSLDFMKRVSDTNFNKIFNAVLSNLNCAPKSSVENDFEILEMKEQEVARMECDQE